MNDACKWCISAAVKSACHSNEDAESLPASIFDCYGNKLEEEPFEAENEEPEEETASTEQPTYMP